MARRDLSTLMKGIMGRSTAMPMAPAPMVPMMGTQLRGMFGGASGPPGLGGALPPGMGGPIPGLAPFMANAIGGRRIGRRIV